MTRKTETSGTERNAGPGKRSGRSADLARVERAKRQLEQMIDLNPEGMVLVEAQGTIARANRALLSLVGASGFADVLGRRLAEVFAGGDATALAEAERFFGELLGARTGYAVRERSLTRTDGTDVLLRFAVVHSEGAMDLQVVIVSDATADRDRADALEHRHKREAVEQLMGALAHHLNQPLAVIMVRAHLVRLALEKGPVRPEDLKRSLGDIMDMTMSVAGMLEKIRTPTDFVTEDYLPGVEILDLQRSGGADGRAGAKAWRDVWGPAMEFLVRALDVHEPGAALHAKRVAAGVAFLAERLAKGPQERESAWWCGYLHDIGKLGVEEAVLRKPAALDAAETRAVRRHAELGYEFLRSFPFLQAEAEAAHGHHEWHNGGGYPRGLAGEAIGPMARLVAVVDAFDAMRVRRPYRPAAPAEAVAWEILHSGGTQFAPEIVGLFRTHYRELDRIVANATA